MKAQKKFPCSVTDSDYLEVTVYEDESVYLCVKDDDSLKGYVLPYVQSLREAIKSGFFDGKLVIDSGGLDIDMATFCWNDDGESVIAWLDSLEAKDAEYSGLVDLLIDNAEMTSYFTFSRLERSNLRELFTRNLRAYGVDV